MRQALSGVAGVVAAEVAFEEGRAEVRHTPELEDPEMLVEAVEKAGFRARVLEAGEQEEER